MTAVEVFASYSPRHRRNLSPLTVRLRDDLRMGLEGHGLVRRHRPRHRAEGSR